MGATGTTTLDFGAAPGGNTASVAVIGQSGVLAASSFAEAFLMADSTADHNAEEHMLAPIKLTCGALVDGVGFTVFARSDWRLSGTFSVRWVWS